jgi:hypothetical protein
MEAYLNKGIKEVIDQFPEVEKILDEYGIGCGPCSKWKRFWMNTALGVVHVAWVPVC